MSISSELSALAQRVRLLEEAGDTPSYEQVKRYFYGKGSLDYRDKLIEEIGALPKDLTVTDALNVILGTFPDPYPGL